MASPPTLPLRRSVGHMHRLLVAAAAVTILGGCTRSAARIDLAPVTPNPTGTHNVGQFVWYDLLTEDAAAAKQFYGELFGWQFQDIQGEGIVYSVISHQGVPIGGLAPMEDTDIEVANSRWLSLMSVDDVDAAVAVIVQAGGSVNMEPWDNPTRGRMALVTDPQGALVVFLRSVGGDPPNLDEDNLVSNRWMFTELWAHDPSAAVEVYGAVAGYTAERVTVGPISDYVVLKRDGRTRAGVNQLPWEEVQSNWLPYVKVDDPAATAARVEALGGRILFPPSPEARNGSVALVMDPMGAAFAIQKWPPEGGTEGGAR